MWPFGAADVFVLVTAAALAVAAIAFPARRRIRLIAVIALVVVSIGYTVLRPGGRDALDYYKQQGGAWSKEWAAGVDSITVVQGHFPTVVLVAAVLLAIIALRSK